MAIRFWRILVHANNGDSSWKGAIPELEFINSGSVVSVGGTASASDYYTSTYVPEKAFDGDTGTTWHSQKNMAFPYFLGYEWPTEVAIDAIRIKSASTRIERMPTQFEIQFSEDGVTWETTADGLITTPAWGANESREFPVTVGSITLAGNAKKSDGTPVDKVIIFSWGTGEYAMGIVPESTGDWQGTLIDGVYGITYLGAGHAPQTHGPYGPSSP